MRRLLSAGSMALFAGALVLAACSSNSVGMTPKPGPTPIAATVTVDGQPAGPTITLKKGRHATVVVTSSAGGPYLFSISDSAIATLAALPVAAEGANRRDAARPGRERVRGGVALRQVHPHAVQTLTSQNGKVDLTATARGSATLTIAFGSALLYTGSVEVSATTPTPTPSGGPTPTPTPSGGPTPTPTPTGKPTPTPTPTGKPTPTPTPTATPAYCANYHTPPPGASPNNPVTFTDDSGLPKVDVLFYDSIYPGKYLAANGTPVTTTAPIPLPIACYPGSTGGSGQTFEIPGGSNGRLYVAYATPVPGQPTAVPNPFANVSSAPSLDLTSTSYVGSPWDYLEYTLPSGTIDVTQVDKVGLPIELSIGTQPTVGVSSSGYANVLTQFQALSGTDAVFKNLLVSSSFDGKNVLARIINPGYGWVWGMPQDWYTNPAFGSVSAPYSLGFLGYVLAQYGSPTASFVYDITPANASYPEYNACSDGSTEFVFTPTSAGPCNLSAPGTITIPASLLEPTGAGHSCASLIFQQPYGLAQVGSVFSSDQQFYLWKSLTIDLNRGTILTTGQTHPVGGLGTGPPQPSLSLFGQDAIFDTYWQILHANFDNHQAYAIPYDEPGNFASAPTGNAPTPIHITVNRIPTGFVQPSPTPAPVPSGCTT